MHWTIEKHEKVCRVKWPNGKPLIDCDTFEQALAVVWCWQRVKWNQ